MIDDKVERNKIFDELDYNLLVEASAGSGKTTLLVEKLVALIEKRNADPSKMAALTFTKKAAAEFYDRFYKKLQLRTKDGFDVEKDDKYSLLPNPTKEEVQRDKEALKKIDTVYLGTIDAFYQRILSEHPLEAGIASSSILIEEDDLDSVLTKKYSSYICSNDKKIRELALFFSNNVGGSNFNDLAKFALNNRLYNLVQIHDNIDDLKSHYKDVLRDYIKGVRVLVDNKDILDLASCKKSDEAWEYLSNNIGRIERLDPTDLGDAKRMFHKILELRFVANEKTACFAHCNFLRLFAKEAQDDNGNVKRNKDGSVKYYTPSEKIIEYIDKIVFYYAIEFIKLIIDDLKLTLKEKGLLTFSEATIYLLELLRNKDNQIVIDQIRKQYDYFLIDECQDTDISQYEIFFRLAGNNYPSSWKNMDIIGGKLFIVGDRKQSIYHFRGADVSTFDEIKSIFDSNNANGKPFDVVTLTNNFRSKGSLILKFNEMFNKLLCSQGYEDIPNGNDENICRAYIYASSAQSRYDDVINIIKTKVKDGYQFKDFMVITQSKKETSVFSKHLMEASIPSYSEGDVDFKISAYLEAVINLFKYLGSNKEDKISYLELLSSPLFNFDVSGSIDLSKDYLSSIGINSSSIDKWPSNTLESLASNHKILASLDIYGFDILSSLIHLLKIEEASGHINSYSDAIIFINKALEPQTIEKVSPLSSDINAVEIANAHKTKGLEKKIVILTWSGATSEKPNLVKQGDSVYIFSRSMELPNGGSIEVLSNPDKNTYLKDIYEKEIDYQKEEVQRLLYVAATRAREFLFIPKSNKKGKWDDLIGEVKFESFSLEDCGPIKRDSKGIANFVSVISEHKKDVNLQSYSYVSPSKIEKINQIFDEGEIISKESTDELALKGTMIHKLMEYIVNGKEYVLPDEACENIVTAYGCSGYLDTLIKIKNTIYQKGYKQNECPFDDIYQFIKPYKCLTEVPFAYKEKDKITHGYIDLIIETENEIIIVDYKTGLESIDHSEQLKAYEIAVSRKYNKPVKSYIYYLNYSHLITSDLKMGDS